MACLEWDCSCGFFTMNNKPRMTCPDCGKTCHGTFDEVPEEPDVWNGDTSKGEPDWDEDED